MNVVNTKRNINIVWLISAIRYKSIASQLRRGRRRLVDPPGCRDWGIAKDDAILTISGPNSVLQFNIDQGIVPLLITLISELYKRI